MKLVNPRNGKVYKNLTVAEKAKFPKPIEYISMFRHGMKYLAKLKLTPTETAVFFSLLGRLEFENWVKVSQKTIAEELDLQRPRVTKAIKKLTELEVILRETDPSDERRTIYRLNPSLGWRGEPKEWVECAASRNDEPTPPCFVRKK